MNELNTTELQKLGRDIGVSIPKTMKMDKALDYVADSKQPNSPDLTGEKTAMESHIQRYIRRLKSQLPDCTGKCSSHGCPDIVVSRCWLLFKDHIV